MRYVIYWIYSNDKAYKERGQAHEYREIISCEWKIKTEWKQFFKMEDLTGEYDRRDLAYQRETW